MILCISILSSLHNRAACSIIVDRCSLIFYNISTPARSKAIISPASKIGLRHYSVLLCGYLIAFLFWFTCGVQIWRLVDVLFRLCMMPPRQTTLVIFKYIMIHSQLFPTHVFIVAPRTYTSDSSYWIRRILVNYLIEKREANTFYVLGASIVAHKAL